MGGGRGLGFRQKSAKLNLGRQYHFRHLACCPCVDAYDLFRDDSYDWESWQRRKSWKRHHPSILTCVQVAAWYWPPVLLTVAIACMLGVYHEKAEPRGAPNLSGRDLTEPFALTSTALALILTFRTNSAYDRWWEARKILGGLLGVTRDIVRIAMSVSRPDCQHLVAMIGRWTIAMPYVLRTHVTEFSDVAEPLQRILLERELDFLTAARHRPSAVTQALSDAAVALCTADIKYVHLSSRISQYHDMVAASERLLRQPIPTAYTRHTSRFLVTYLIFVPFALWRTCDWLTPFIAGMVGFLLVGIENIGIQIEQPFTVLPLDRFSAIIEADIVEMLQMREESETLVAAAEDEAAFSLQRPECLGVGAPPPRKSVDISAAVWPTGEGPSFIPQHMTIIPEDEVDFDDIEAQKQNRKPGSSHIYIMEPTSGCLAHNGSPNMSANGLGAGGIANRFVVAGPRRPPSPQSMDGGRSSPDRSLDADGDGSSSSGSSGSGSAPDSGRDDSRGGDSREGAVNAAAGPQGGDGGGGGRNPGSDPLPALHTIGKGGGDGSRGAGGGSRRFASMDDGLRQLSQPAHRPSQEGGASRRGLLSGGGGSSRRFASVDGPPRRSSWRQRLSMSLDQPPASALGRPDSCSLDQIVVDMDRLEEAAGDKGF